MRYTENYHLPQWDENDRIMRTDFNRMCAGIEDGLTRGKDSGEMLETRTLDRFCRMAYNHYHLVKDMDPFPEQSGVFYQDPAKDPANVSGTMLWSGVCFAGSGETGVNYEKFLDCVQIHSQLNVVKNRLDRSTPLELTFRAPAAGMIRRFSLQGPFSNNVENTPAPFRLTMTDQDGGGVVLTQELDFKQVGTNGFFVNYMVNGPFFFHSGSRYRLKLEPLAAVYDLETTFALNEHTPVYCYCNNSPVTASHTFHETADSTGGMLILQCAVGGPKGKLTVAWDGRELKPAASKPRRDELGRQFREYVYIRDEVIPANSTVTLRFEDGGSGDFLFYDWGAVLL